MRASRSMQLGEFLRRLLLGQLAEDDHAEHLVLGHLGGVARADEAAVLHHAHPVGEVEDVVQVVADEEDADRSEEHTSELQSLMRISYAVFCLKKKKEKIMSSHNNVMIQIKCKKL